MKRLREFSYHEPGTLATAVEVLTAEGESARVLAGGRVSIAVGISAMLVAITLGTVVGGLAGYYSSLDGPLMRLTDMFLRCRCCRCCW